MTPFGWMLIGLLSALLWTGISARRRGSINGSPITKEFNPVLVIIAFIIVGILTVGTGSLL